MTDLLDTDFSGDVVTALIQRATEVSLALLHAAHQVLSGQRSGRVYRLPGGLGTYQASAPGEPPADRTGAFRASWQVIPPTLTHDGHTLTVHAGIRTSGVPYATRFDPELQPYLGGVAPRPFVEPILALAEADIDGIYAGDLEDVE